MFTTMLLGTAVAAGQPPVPMPAYSYPLIPAQAAPAPMPMGTPVPMPMNGGAPAGNGNGDACKKDEEKPEEKEATKYFVEKLLAGTRAGQLLSDRGIRIYGWTQMSYTASSASKSNLPITFNDRANEFQLNQNFLRIEKAIDTSKKEVQYGWKTEYILPGTDARYSIPRGLFDNQLRNGVNGGPRNYPIDIYQMYGEFFLPNIGEGTTVRVGRFATHCEYELVQGAENPFLSRSYTFQYNPFTHTGVWATTQLNDDWAMSHGAALGSDNFIDPASRLTYLGQLKWAPKDGKTTVLFNAVVTNPKFFVAENFAFYNVYNTQVIHKFTDKFTYVFDAAFSHMDNIPGAGGQPGLHSAHWYGFANYFLWQVTDKVASNFRAELFEDEKGVRTGFAGLYTGLTYGLTWTPKDALMIRPFVRYDTNSRSRPFEGDHDVFLAGLDVIVRW